MFNVDHVKCFLAQVGMEQITLFIAVLIVLSLITYVIRTTATTITKAFPKKRMTIFSWVPIFNFTIYTIGFFGAIYIIFKPSDNVYLGFLASIVVGIVIAAKEIFQSVIAGFILLIDKPFQVGDRVNFKGDYGEVVSIGLRSVKIMTLNQDIVTIPNQRFIADIVNSSSTGDVEMMVSIKTHVPANVDLNEVKSILEKAAQTNSYVNTEKPITVVAEEVVAGNSVIINFKTRCVIKDDRAEQEFQTDFVIATNKALAARNIR